MSITQWTRVLLVVASLFDIVAGLIHFLASDGGANSIAGIVLDWDNATTVAVSDDVWNASKYHNEVVLVLFAALGLIQIKLGTITALLAYWLPQGIVLFRFVWLLVGFQLIKIITDIAGYRNIHSVAPYAPGGYKPPVVMVFYFAAVVLQTVWYRRGTYTRVSSEDTP